MTTSTPATRTATARFASVRALRAGPVSVRYSPRSLIITGLLIILLLAASVVHISYGGTAIPTAEVISALLGDDSNSRTHLAVTEFRAPRLVAGIVAGACLAVAGAITQTVAKNPLASPDILGVTAGASLGAVSVLVLAGGGAGGLSGLVAGVGLPIGAFAGGLTSGVAVYLLALKGGLDSYRLILVGLGLNGLATSLTTWLLTLGDVSNAAQALTWMSGSINGKDWPLVTPMSLVAVALIGVALLASRWLSLTSLGDDTVVSLGARGALISVAMLSIAVLLASVGTVVAGPLVFVALASPQIARLLSRAVVPPPLNSALVGAVFVLIADTLAANLLHVSLPVGVVTAVLGGPYLIFLVLRYQRRLT